MPVTLLQPLTATDTRLAVGQGQVRTVIPVPRGDLLTLSGSPALYPPALVRLTGGTDHADWTVPRQDVPFALPLLRVPLLGPRETAAACCGHALILAIRNHNVSFPNSLPRSMHTQERCLVKLSCHNDEVLLDLV